MARNHFRRTAHETEDRVLPGTSSVFQNFQREDNIPAACAISDGNR